MVRRVRKQSPRLVLIAGLALIVVLVLGRKQEDVGTLPAGENAPGERSLAALHILPAPAQTFHELRAEGRNVQAAFSAGAESSGPPLIWSVNGEDVGEGPSLAPEHFRRGDRVAVRLATSGETAAQGSARAEIVIANSPPRLRSAVLQRPAERPGRAQIVVDAFDPDGDPVELEYRWTVDGRTKRSGGQPWLEIAELPAGSELGCRVLARDRESVSAPLECAPLRLSNHPPRLESAGAAVLSGPAGTRTGRLPLRTSDPDGDTLTVTILEGPRGARWDPKQACVVWPVVEGDRTELKVRIEDGKGGSIERSFRVLEDQGS